MGFTLKIPRDAVGSSLVMVRVGFLRVAEAKNRFGNWHWVVACDRGEATIVLWVSIWVKRSQSESSSEGMGQLDSSIGFLFWFFPSCPFLSCLCLMYVLDVCHFYFIATIYAFATAPSVHFFFFLKFTKKTKKKPKTKNNPTVGLK
jgi:hypothetical protein